jgi:hypothetical protein
MGEKMGNFPGKMGKDGKFPGKDGKRWEISVCHFKDLVQDVDLF